MSFAKRTLASASLHKRRPRDHTFEESKKVYDDKGQRGHAPEREERTNMRHFENQYLPRMTMCLVKQISRDIRWTYFHLLCNIKASPLSSPCSQVLRGLEMQICTAITDLFGGVLIWGSNETNTLFVIKSDCACWHLFPATSIHCCLSESGKVLLELNNAHRSHLVW